MSNRGRLLTLITDAIIINAGFIVGYLMRYNWRLFLEIGYDARLEDYAPIQFAFTLAFLAMFQLDGVYTRRRSPAWFEQMYSITNSSAKAIVMILALVFIYRPAVYSRLMIVEAGLAVIVLMGVSRLLEGTLESMLRRRGIGVANVLIVGAGELGRAVMRTLVARPDLGYRCIGFIDDDPSRGNTNIGRFPALGPLDCLPEILRRQRVNEVVVTLPWSAQPKIMQVVDLCHHRGVRARVVPSLLQINLGHIDVNDFGGIPLLSMREGRMNPDDHPVKRGLDFIGASLALLFSAPIIAFVAILVRLESPGSPIFAQTRIGKHGKPFKLYKLRSMRDGADAEKSLLLAQNEADGPLFKMRNDPRLTRIGRIIRRTSIDELLQFWNVLRGEMSIVGPRPNLPDEVAQYTDWQRARMRVRPGITGLSQISGRSELTFDETCLLDIYYIENWSPSLDLKIVLRTIPFLLTARGAY
ncbi:MAG: sugar transferase [Chloroflexi bacterium]|nr:sugar transferase [Chloroflexota bacterium]